MYVELHVEDMRGVVPPLDVIYAAEACRAAQELLVDLLLGGAPLRLGECGHARQHHILHLCHVGDIFGPEVCLHAHDVPLLVGRERAGHGLVGIYALDGEGSAYGEGFRGGILGLIVVEVVVCVGCHDDVVVEACRGYSAALAAP